ncbi:MAG: hypothetical protein AMDU1_APLC00042G0002 [Thermoplasmatales archaeon A-plasma]|nr:MAG: hypothetical protein AMDU1_APLC00042G0002 [Thermoplasmatales archaeon A-plasma]
MSVVTINNCLSNCTDLKYNWKLTENGAMFKTFSELEQNLGETKPSGIILMRYTESNTSERNHGNRFYSDFGTVLGRVPGSAMKPQTSSRRNMAWARMHYWVVNSP